MPTPIGHSLAGTAIRLAAGKSVAARWWTWPLIVVLANLPDIDFLPGYLVGDPRKYHWAATHSIAAALIVGLLVGAVVRWRGGRFALPFTIATAAYLSHILLDTLIGPGPTPSLGLMVFWPFDTSRYMFPWSVFRMAPASIASDGPIGALFSVGILPVIAREVLVLGPVVTACWVLARIRRSADSSRNWMTSPFQRRAAGTDQ